MATRTATYTAATLANTSQAVLQRDTGGQVRVLMDAAAPGSPTKDVRVLLLADSSLTTAQRTAFVDAWAILLGDIQALEPAYS